VTRLRGMLTAAIAVFGLATAAAGGYDLMTGRLQAAAAAIGTAAGAAVIVLLLRLNSQLLAANRALIDRNVSLIRQLRSPTDSRQP
jgi:uncharacterized membrane protein YccC